MITKNKSFGTGFVPNDFNRYIRHEKVDAMFQHALRILYNLPITPDNLYEFFAEFFRNQARTIIHCSLLKAEICYKEHELQIIQETMAILGRRKEYLTTTVEKMEDGTHFLFNFFLNLLKYRIKPMNLLSRFLRDCEKYPADKYPPELEETEVHLEADIKDLKLTHSIGNMENNVYFCEPLTPSTDMEETIKTLDPWGMLYASRHKSSDRTEVTTDNDDKQLVEVASEQFLLDGAVSIAEDLIGKGKIRDGQHTKNLQILKPPKINLSDMLGWESFYSTSEITFDPDKKEFDEDSISENLKNQDGKFIDPCFAATEKEDDKVNIEKIFGSDMAAFSDFEEDNINFLDEFHTAIERLQPPKPKHKGTKLFTKRDQEFSDFKKKAERLYDEIESIMSVHSRAASMLNIEKSIVELSEKSLKTVSRDQYRSQYSQQRNPIRNIFSLRSLKHSLKPSYAKMFAQGRSIGKEISGLKEKQLLKTPRVTTKHQKMRNWLSKKSEPEALKIPDGSIPFDNRKNKLPKINPKQPKYKHSHHHKPENLQPESFPSNNSRVRTTDQPAKNAVGGYKLPQRKEGLQKMAEWNQEYLLYMDRLKLEFGMTK